jgi:hypothetical protein
LGHDYVLSFFGQWQLLPIERAAALVAIGQMDATGKRLSPTPAAGSRVRGTTGRQVAAPYMEPFDLASDVDRIHNASVFGKPV